MTTQVPSTKEQQNAAVKEATDKANTSLTRPQRLELFIRYCQSGCSVISALKQSGLATGYVYDPADPQAQVDCEETFLERVAARLDKTRPGAPYAVFPDDQFPEEPKKGDLKQSQVFMLVDWLYFTRSLPLTTIAQFLQLRPVDVAKIKGELSGQFAQALRKQSGEAYIADLLRQKDMIKADLYSRRNGSRTTDAINIDKLVWEMENRFVDRLQEIGMIDKTLGRVDINEEWHVTIGPAGQPENTKLIPSTSISQDDSFLDAEEQKKEPASNDLGADWENTSSTEDKPNGESLSSEHLPVRPTLATGVKSTIRVD